MEMSQTIKNIVYLVLIVLASFLLGYCNGVKSTQDKGGVLTSKVEVKTDTVYIQLPPIVHDTIIYKFKKVLVYLDRPVPLKQKDGTPTLAHRVYKDTLNLEKDLQVSYEARVSGVLDSIKLGLRDTRPIKEIYTTKTITNTLTVTKHPTGLYVGAFAATQSINNPLITNFGPEIQVVRPAFNLGVGYDLKQSSPQLRIGINLLKRDK